MPPVLCPLSPAGLLREVADELVLGQPGATHLFAELGTLAAAAGHRGQVVASATMRTRRRACRASAGHRGPACLDVAAAGGMMEA